MTHEEQSAEIGRLTEENNRLAAVMQKLCDSQELLATKLAEIERNIVKALNLHDGAIRLAHERLESLRTLTENLTVLVNAKAANRPPSGEIPGSLN